MTPTTSVALVVSVALSLSSVAHGQSKADNDAAAEQDADDDLTSDVWREPDAPISPLRHLLALPEYVVELAFTPIALLVTGFERYRLDRRLHDLLRNDAGTIVVSPRIKLSFSDGIGGGAKLAFKRLLNGQSTLELGALGRLNGDYELDAGYEHDLASLEGRGLVLAVRRELDQNLKFYGIGPDSAAEAKRVIRSEVIESFARLDLTRKDVTSASAALSAGYRRELLLPGSDPVTPPVGEPGDMIIPPDDFMLTLNYAEVSAHLTYDSRDTVGRPTRGVYAEFSAAAAVELTGEPFSAFAFRASVAAFFQPLPDKRVFVLSAGARASAPLQESDSIPLYQLTTLGRRNNLRGFGRGRFRDRHGWWAGAEYRFPVFQYINTGIALETVVFGETGRVSSALLEMFNDVPEFSGGIGVRAAHDVTSVLGLELGWSAEGPQLAFTLGQKF